MGTNIYVTRRKGRSDFHLGKRSAGWKFLFHADSAWPREKALENWLKLALKGEIYTEYKEPMSFTDLFTSIMDRQGLHDHRDYDPELFGPAMGQLPELWKEYLSRHWTVAGFNFTEGEFN